jgi:hypothetical protein
LGTGNAVESQLKCAGEPAQLASAANSFGHFDCSWPQPLSQLASSGGPPPHFAATTLGQIELHAFDDELLLLELHASPHHAMHAKIAQLCHALMAASIAEHPSIDVEECVEGECVDRESNTE